MLVRPMPRMKVRLTPNWSPTDRLGTALASEPISLMPPVPIASAEIAVTDAPIFDSDSERRVAVTTMSATVVSDSAAAEGVAAFGVAGGKSCAATGAATRNAALASAAARTIEPIMEPPRNSVTYLSTDA